MGELPPDDSEALRSEVRGLGGLPGWLSRPATLFHAAASYGLDGLVTTLFPGDCRVCFMPLIEASLAPVCSSCIAEIPPQPSTMALCWHCGEALGMESARFAGQFAAESLRCTPCRLVPPVFTRAVAFAVYQDEVRETIHLLKYERMASLAEPLGAKLAEAMLQLEGAWTTGDEAGQAGAGEVLVVAVPLYPAKQRQRGYNQAELLADAAIARLKKLQPQIVLTASHHVLRRIKDTESQFNLSAKGRRRNLDGAFAVLEPARVKGRSIVLIDDIYTSGATSRACSESLIKAGAREVWVATVARAQREMVELWESDG